MMRFTAIDFETANRDRASVCSVGLVVVEDGKLVRQFHQLIRPDPLRFDPFHVSIHRISEADVSNAPTFSDFWPQLWSLVSGPLVAHNAAFDMSVLRQALAQAGRQHPDTEYLCTLVLSRIAWPNRSSYALNQLAHMLEIPHVHHNAQEDARACALVALAACERLQADCLQGLCQGCGLQMGQLFADGHVPCSGARSVRSNSPQRERCRAADVVATSDSLDLDGACCGKVFVFTGGLSAMPRRDAMQAVVDRGGSCRDTVRADTDYLVLGQMGFVEYQAGVKTRKLMKVEELKAQGTPIEILSEDEFIRML